MSDVPTVAQDGEPLPSPASQRENLADYLVRLGLPRSLVDRRRDRTPAVQKLLDIHQQQVEVEGRAFHLGLMLSFLGIAEEACERLQVESVPNLLTDYRPLTERNGRRMNTLTIPVPNGRPIRLRGYYNRAEQAIRYWLARRSYPSEAPHATQAWEQHRAELESVLALGAEERASLIDALWDRIIAMPKPAYRGASDARIRPFVVVMEKFNAASGEPAGIVLQSLGYAYFNVQLSHLTAVESDKVRVGGARRGNVGDIDGWDAAELVQTIEVKDLALTAANEVELAGFIANLVKWPDATAIVLANSFQEPVKENLARQNIFALTRAEIVNDVRSWDMERQRRAIRAMDYYVIRVQGHHGFSGRWRDFLIQHEITLD